MILLLALMACAPPPDGPMVCNGSIDTCERPLNGLTLAMTHNSHANEDRGYHQAAMNQYPSVTRQLIDGIRALNYDVYLEDVDASGQAEMILCHGFCILGFQTLEEGLREIDSFLDMNPNELVLLVLQNEAPVQDTVAAFESSSLFERMHTQLPGQPWPTWGEMVLAEQRFVLFSDPTDEEVPDWFHAENEFIYGTPWGTKTKGDFTCQLDQDPFSYGLFSLNHTLTNPIASPDLATSVNDAAYLEERVGDCSEIGGKTPNLIEVDYYTTGDVVEVVSRLNAELSP
jgi:hypothetical protein